MDTIVDKKDLKRLARTVVYRSAKSFVRNYPAKSVSASLQKAYKILPNKRKDKK